MKATCAFLLFLVAAGCGCKECGKKDGGEPETVARLDDRHTLAAPVTVGNLTVWPVVTDRPLDLGEFLTLDEALAKGAAEVREVGGAAPAQEAQVSFGEAREEAPAAQAREEAPAARQQAAHALELEPPTLGEAEPAQQVLGEACFATVGTLVIENKGDLPILVCAGTVVKGGNQDRQIGQDFVLKAQSTTPVDAFCVEQGRWQSDRLGKETGGKFQVLEGMATAKVRAKGQYEKDQGGVWQEVAAFSALDNPTLLRRGGVAVLHSTSYAVAFDASAAASAEELKRCEDAMKRHFKDHPSAVGFAYAVNGKPVAVRTFAHPRLLAKQLDDFVRGMATESLVAKSDAPAKQAEASDVVALVKAISAAEEKVSGTSGVNRNGVRVNATGFNANCYVADEDGKLAAVTRDWTAK